jgi:bile acid:Na+ symporter, BASS family
MHPVDEIHIHFNPDQMVVLNIAMAFLMFSVALDVKISDFKQVLLFPKSILIGMVAQYLLFPIFTMGLIYAFKPPVSIALGMVLVSGCPSGNITNFLVHYARANVALSVTLNAIIILIATIITPASFIFWSKYVPESEAIRKSFSLEFLLMAKIVITLILAPLLFGMWLNSQFPAVIDRIRKQIQRLSLVIFFTILILALWGNRENMAQYLGFVFILVAVHNIIGLGTGYSLGRLTRLSEQDCRTLAFETGVHNTALGLILIFQFFGGLGGMALIAAWWGIWDLVTGVGLATYWRGFAHRE